MATSPVSALFDLYTAHPDKHMHALGVEHEEVGNVVRGLEREVERFWRVLGDREALVSGRYDLVGRDGLGPGPGSGECSRLDAAVVVTADHGHVTVRADEMVPLPREILDLLEYACIGVHGKVSCNLPLWSDGNFTSFSVVDSQILHYPLLTEMHNFNLFPDPKHNDQM